MSAALPAPPATRLVYAASLGAHVALGLWLGSVHIAPRPEPVVVEVQTIERPRAPNPPPPPKAPEPPKPEPAPAPKPAPAPAKAAPPAPELAAAPPPRFGISLGGAPGGGPGGVSVPIGSPGGQVRQASHVLGTSPAAKPDNACPAPDTRAKPAGAVPQPTYTEEALRQTPVPEGKVRIQLSIAADGSVTEAKVLEGLGFGLDEAAVQTLKQARFNPATHCGEPVASTFVVALRFAP